MLHLEYDDTAKVIFRPQAPDGAFVTETSLKALAPSGTPLCQDWPCSNPFGVDDEITYGDPVGELVGQGAPYETIYWTFAEDNEINVIDDQDAIIESVEVKGLSRSALVEMQAIDLLTTYADGMALLLSL